MDLNYDREKDSIEGNILISKFFDSTNSSGVSLSNLITDPHPYFFFNSCTAF